MKKTNSILNAVIITSFIAIWAVIPAHAYSQQSSTASIPEDVFKIFKNSCMGCHSNDGGFMAKGALNFSVWDQYKPEKQAGKAKDIVGKVKKGAMPPKSAREANPNGIPTEEQIALISKWADSFTVKN